MIPDNRCSHPYVLSTPARADAPHSDPPTGSADNGYYTNPTITYLRSAVIDLSTVSGASLSFAEALDVAAADTAKVYIIDDTTDTVIEAARHGDLAKRGDATRFQGAYFELINGTNLMLDAVVEPIAEAKSVRPKRWDESLKKQKIDYS